MKAPPVLWPHSLAECKVSALSLLSVTLEHCVQASQIAQRPYLRYPSISEAEMCGSEPLDWLACGGIAPEWTNVNAREAHLRECLIAFRDAGENLTPIVR